MAAAGAFDGAFMAPLTDADMENLAAYYASLK